MSYPIDQFKLYEEATSQWLILGATDDPNQAIRFASMASKLWQSYKAKDTLHAACYAGALEIASRLITIGADVNKNERHPRSPLWLAAYAVVQLKRKIAFDICFLLLQHGADMNWQSVAPTRYRSSHAHTDDAYPETRFQHFAISPILIALHGEEIFLEQLLLGAVDLNARYFSETGNFITALHKAAAIARVEKVHQLLLAGASVDSPSSYGTPLMFAVAMANVENCDLLLESGANVNY